MKAYMPEENGPNWWRDIPGYGGKYQVNRLGEIRRVFPSGSVRDMTPYKKSGAKHKKILRNRLFVKLTGENGSKEVAVLKIVAGAWHGPTPSGMVPYHKNGIVTDNRAENIGFIDKQTLGRNTGHMAEKRRTVFKINTSGEVVEIYRSAREAAKAKGPELKLGKDRKLAEYIEHKIADEQYSPAAVLGRIKAKGLKFNTTISVNTLYSYIDKGVFLRITNKDLPVKGSRKREYRHTKAQSRAPKGESIEKRPEEINNRETFGHWEMDCVESAKGCTTTLLVLTERLSRREITRRMEAKKAENVVAELDALEKRYGELFPLIFKSITVDNGSEFANCEGMERSSLREGEKRTKLYYCHPYSAYERGSNENQNKLVRRHAPKGSSFEDMTDERADYIEGWMNDYPRKMFNWHTPEEVFQTEIKALSGAL